MVYNYNISYLIIPGNDLVPVLKAILTVNGWQALGLMLGLKKYALDVIDLHNRGKVEDCRIEMVSQWLDTGEATWRRLVQALESPMVNKRGLAVEIARQHPSMAEEIFRCFRSDTADKNEAIRLIHAYNNPSKPLSDLVDWDDPKDKRRSLLQWACIRGWSDVVETLINEYKCDPYYDGDRDKWTLLHNVCYNGHIKLVHDFLDKPFYMDPLKKNAKGDTPLSLARKMSHQDIVEYLENVIGSFIWLVSF